MGVGSTILSFAVAIVAGAFGSVLGIGGGLFIIPTLTLLGISLKTAIATSIVAVIVTSLAGGNVYVRQHVADVRLGILLAMATAPAAVVGALISTAVSPRVLSGVFALVIAASAYRMWRGGRPAPVSADSGSGGTSGRLRFREAFLDASSGQIVRYRVERVPLGVTLSTAAGLISGMLGVGGGVVQVPVMNLLMGVPIKVATTTSTYIIGITAMAGAFVYYNHRPSYMDPALAVPVTIGVFIGATAGANLLARVSEPALRATFIVILAIYTVQMVLRVVGVAG
jgi:uncharacterized membrane protein YfcA